MISKKQKQVSLYYLNNILKRRLSAKMESDVLDWAEGYARDFFAMEMESKYADEEEKKRRKIPHTLKALRAVLARQNIVDITSRGYDKNLDAIFDAFKIAEDASAVLRYMIYVETMTIINDLGYEFTRFKVSGRQAFAIVTGLTPMAVNKHLSMDSPLVVKGLIGLNCDGDAHFSSSLRRILKHHFKQPDKEKVRQLVVGKSASATLCRDNFGYIGDDYNHICALLQNSLRERKSGINILLYGIPGTGKTEMCKAIAQDVGAKLYTISENGENDKEKRLTDLLSTRSLLEDDKDAVILFDEAEDAFSRNPFVENNNSKLFYNRMLEQNKTPVIWISNNIGRMDPAYIRRFKYALEVEKPDDDAKEEIWKSICGRHRVRMSGKKIAEFAKKYDVPPSLIDTAVDSAKLIGRGVDGDLEPKTIEHTIKALHKAAYGPISISRNKDDCTRFIPELLNTDVDLGGLTEKLTAKGAMRFSLCLYGAPGTGKSAFARHLAEKMELDVIQKRASDLISKWVGGTERNIAEAFGEARDKESILVFDEADSLLRDRKLAGHSWEVTQVNEMLTWMESHPYPFICTTNLMKDVDEASLRRFTFKVKYGHLKSAQVKLAFKHFFGVDVKAPPAHLTHLAPGDFAVVKAKQELLDITDRAELVKMLESEQSAKGIKAAKMGFA